MKTTSKSNLFFLELIIMLLVVSFSLAVCTQVFYYAKKTANYSRDLSNATAKAQSAAACYKAAAGSLAKTAEYLPSKYADAGLAAYYDKEWRPAAAEQGAFRLSVSEENQGALIQVVRLADRREIFSLKVKAIAYE